MLSLAFLLLVALASSGVFAALAIAYHQRAGAVQAHNFQLRKEHARLRLALGLGVKADEVRALAAPAPDPADPLEIQLALPAYTPAHERKEQP